MPGASKQSDPAADGEATAEAIRETLQPSATDAAEDESADDGPVASSNPDVVAESSTAKKKKSKRKKIKAVLKGESSKSTDGASASSSKPAEKLSGHAIDELLKANPALEKELAGMPKDKVEAMLKKLSMSDLLTGMAVGGKNQKDMASYKFWQTQPVPRLGDKAEVKEGPIKIIDPERIPKAPAPLVEGFDWVTMDLTDQKELEEVYELLTGHYVEDDEAMFRFNYSVSFLNWALKSPGWRNEWHVGVRATKSRKLVAFISGVPVQLRIRENTLPCAEVNFLCIHKKLRDKRLTPVLIQEITRRCYQAGVWHAIYTAGIVLPTPISSCRYYHRSLDWLKLHEVGFSPLPEKSSKAIQIAKYRLPSNTSTKGLRQMEAKDIDAVVDLLKRYLEKFDTAPIFTREEVEHWLLHVEKPGSDQVIWTYVVQDPGTGNITDFFSFYCLESSVIRTKKHSNVRAAYLFYYATETGMKGKGDTHTTLKSRLNELIEDALILAKRFDFDVLNALTLLDNSLFLDKQKFGAGDGQLNYYLYNYSTAPIGGGVDKQNYADEKKTSGVGVVML
ncbi:MAG: glycylpeptide N-tetradecanoyltransferase [Thelocarpon impressellum]|nr:MAG: glycylpeptide N-tetradecanoyltransferase [Thelocarpon impressellum]